MKKSRLTELPWEVLTGLKKILKGVKNEELTAEREEKRDSCNLIIHGSARAAGREAMEEKEKEFVKI